MGNNNNEIKADYLISLIITIIFAIIPGIMDHLDLGPTLSITSMIVLGLLAITMIYVVFKYPNAYLVQKVSFNLKIDSRGARNIFMGLILFVIAASSYIFMRDFNQYKDRSMNQRNFLEEISNNSNMSSELSKLLPYVDSVGFDESEINNYNKIKLHETHEEIKQVFGLDSDDLKISLWKSIRDSLNNCFYYEQNWTGSETDKCFRCSEYSLIGCSVDNENGFILFSPNLAKGDICAWSLSNDPIAVWEGNQINFANGTICEFNTVEGDYQRDGMLCFYVKDKVGNSEVGLCFDFNNVNYKIFKNKVLRTIILELAIEILITPDSFYVVSDFEQLRPRVSSNCEERPNY